MVAPSLGDQVLPGVKGPKVVTCACLGLISGVMQKVPRRDSKKTQQLPRLVQSGNTFIAVQAAIDWLAKTLVRILRSNGFSRKSSAPARLPAIIFFRSASTTQ